MSTRKRAPATPAAPRSVSVLVNGQVVGTVPDTSNVAEAALQVAKTHGLRAFNIKLNGKRIAQPDANKPLKGVKTLEIYAKDSRG